MNKRKELFIQRSILSIGIFFIILGYNFLDLFLDKPSYTAGIGWFISLMVGICLIIYREERLKKFVNSMVGEEK